MIQEMTNDAPRKKAGARNNKVLLITNSGKILYKMNPFRKLKHLLLVYLLVCLSCQSQLSDGDPDLKECGKIEINESEYLIMQIIPEKVSSNSTNDYIIENHTSYDMMWGADYSLEYFEKNNWKVIPLNFVFTDIGYILHAGEVYSSETLNGQMTLHLLIQSQNNGRKGLYRIIRNVTLVTIGNYKLCTEFEII